MVGILMESTPRQIWLSSTDIRDRSPKVRLPTVALLDQDSLFPILALPRYLCTPCYSLGSPGLAQTTLHPGLSRIF